MVVPQRFFYYCPLIDADRRSWFEKLLTHNQIWFRNPRTLNDINELKPKLIFEGTDKELRRFGHEVFQRHSPIELSPARRLQEVTRYVYQLQHNPQEYENLLHEILARLGILSLSATNSEHLLWAHYADGHKGACVEFDSSLGLFLQAHPVTYTSEIPTINRVKDTLDSILDKSMFTKHTRWAYEAEWRVVARWDDQYRKAQYLAQHTVPAQVRSFIEAQNGSGYYSLEKGSITKVILGAKTSSDSEQWLSMVLRQNGNDISLVRARTIANGVIEVP